MIRESKNILWEFIRGDLKNSDFENSFYRKENQFEPALGSELYLKIASNDFNDKDTTFQLKRDLKNYLKEKFPNSCPCIELKNLDVIGMGKGGDLFDFLIHKKERGQPFWWLSMNECKVCGQSWLVAQEERINDDYCLKRLSNQQKVEIEGEDIWPSDFDTYENLLNLSASAGHRVQFADPLNSISVDATIEELRRERPQITESEMANLLSLDIDSIRKLLERPGLSTAEAAKNPFAKLRWIVAILVLISVGGRLVVHWLR